MSKPVNSLKTSPDFELMQKIYEGDYDALKKLYDKYSPVLYTLIKKILKDVKHSEEVLSEIFPFIKKRINTFDINSGSSFTWMIFLAKNKAVYELRKKEGRIENFSKDLENEYIAPKLSHLTETLTLERAYELKYKIETALNRLTDAQQYVIYLAFYEGLTRQEIAKKLRIPLSTVESKIKTSLINLNENFIGKSSLFTVKNETAELIYPFVLGSFDFEEEIKTFNRFKGSEPFPWKLLGDYQNLVSLLPVILEIEYPTEKANEKISNRIYHLKSVKEDKIKTFEPVSSTTSKIAETGKENENEEISSPPPPDEEITIPDEQKEIPTESIKKKTDEYEPVIPFKPKEQEYPVTRKRNYSSILIIGMIVLFIAAAAAAYFFYNERRDYYENQIVNLSNRIESMTNDFRNKPEIAGLAELKNSQTIKLENRSGLTGRGEIILSYQDKRGYLYINNLPELNANSAYQLWGNLEGEFISLGIFKVSSRPEYYPFTLPNNINDGPVEFYLIESNAAGSRRPGSKIYLQGRAE